MGREQTSFRAIVGTALFVFAVSLFAEGQRGLIACFYVGATLFTGAFLLGALARNDKLRTSQFTACYALFFALALFNHLFFSVDPALSGMMVLRIGVILTFMWCVYNAVYLYHIENHVAWGLSLALLINALILFGIVPIWFDPYMDGSRFCGTVGNANVYANMIVTALVLIVAYAYRSQSHGIVFFATLASGLLCLFATGSRAGISVGIILSVGLVYDFARTVQINSHNRPNRRENRLAMSQMRKGAVRLLGTLLCAVLVGACVILISPAADEALRAMAQTFAERMSDFAAFLHGGRGDKSTQFRYLYVKDSLNLFSEHPLTGVGIDCFKSLDPGYAHNNYLELLADLGIFGPLVYYAGFALLFKKTWASRGGLRRLFLLLLALRLLADITIVSYYLRTVFVVCACFEAVLDREADRWRSDVMQVGNSGSLLRNATSRHQRAAVTRL